VSPTAPPPQLPPQVSPDGKWVWDGRQWQPLAVVNWEPAAAAVIPQTAAPRPPTAIDDSPVYIAPDEVLRPASPVYDVAVVEAPSTPLWERPARGTSTYLYVAGGAVVLIMVMIVLNSLSVVPWHFFGSDSGSSAQPTATPIPPATARTEFVRADRFLKYSLDPAVLALNQTLPGLRVCNGTLSNSCLSAITATDQQMKKVLSTIDRGAIPACIATGMTKLRTDLAGMETGLQLGLKGYQDNLAAEVNQGLARFGSGGPALQADGNALDLTLKTCNTLREGP
jgi:hypothetical protein